MKTSGASTILRRFNHPLSLAARWILGGAFIYMGLSKALEPVDFLKLVREYDAIHHQLALNLIAALLPWFEVFCGVLLIVGVAIRGSALALLGLLLGFSALVFTRAWTLHDLQALPFCAVRFDCGCGNGEVLICGKLLENALLMLLSAFVVVRR
jgi:uncharacterized membrane protein YphA (DoxX/SURF4 family)